MTSSSSSAPYWMSFALLLQAGSSHPRWRDRMRGSYSPVYPLHCTKPQQFRPRAAELPLLSFHRTKPQRLRPRAAALTLLCLRFRFRRRLHTTLNLTLFSLRLFSLRLSLGLPSHRPQRGLQPSWRTWRTWAFTSDYPHPQDTRPELAYAH